MTFSIHSHRWHPTGNTTQTRGVYILHGAGEHGMRYDRLAKHLTGLGYIVGAHDHPGHGESDGKRGIIQDEQPFVEHAAIKLNEFTQETGAAPILFGHSTGGVVASAIALDTQVPLAGLILSAPAFEITISRFNRFKLYVLNAVAPFFVQDLAYDPTRLTADKIEQQIAIDDPLMHGFKSASYVMWLLKAGAAAFKLASNLEVDTLLLIPEADPVVNPDRTKEFARNAPQSKISVKCYPGFKHEILNETPDRRNEVTADITDWLEAFSQ